MDPIQALSKKNTHLDFQCCRNFASALKIQSLRLSAPQGEPPLADRLSRPQGVTRPTRTAPVEPEYVDEVFPEGLQEADDPWGDPAPAGEAGAKEEQDLAPQTAETGEGTPDRPRQLRKPALTRRSPGGWRARPWTKAPRPPASRESVSEKDSDPAAEPPPGEASDVKAGSSLPAKAPQGPAQNGKPPAEDRVRRQAALPPMKRFEGILPPAPQNGAPAPEGNTHGPKPVRTRVRLEDVLENGRDLPRNSAVLGVCGDGLPLLLNFLDPAPGSVLVVGDDEPANLAHLRSILASVRRLSAPDQLRIHLVSPEPAEWTDGDTGHVADALVPYERKVFELLGDLYALAESRLKGEAKPTPLKVLIVDALDILVEQLDPQSMAFFRWLLRRGPEAGIWTLAGLGARRTTRQTRMAMRSFGTHLVGRIADRAFVEHLATVSYEQVRGLQPGKQAILKAGPEETLFDIPTLDSDPEENGGKNEHRHVVV